MGHGPSRGQQPERDGEVVVAAPGGRRGGFGCALAGAQRWRSARPHPSRPRPRPCREPTIGSDIPGPICTCTSIGRASMPSRTGSIPKVQIEANIRADYAQEGEAAAEPAALRARHGQRRRDKAKVNPVRPACRYGAQRISPDIEKRGRTPDRLDRAGAVGAPLLAERRQIGDEGRDHDKEDAQAFHAALPISGSACWREAWDRSAALSARRR